MSDLDDFMSETRPSGKASKLDPYLVEIDTLKKHAYSEKDILRFLEEKKGLVVTQPTLNRFIKTRIRNEKVSLKKGPEAENTVMNKESNKHETVRCQDALNPQRVESATDGKFNWLTPIPRDEIF